MLVAIVCAMKCSLDNWWNVCLSVCLLPDDDSYEVDSDSVFGIYRAPYEKPMPLRCIEPLYQLNDDGSVPGMIF